MSLHKFTSIACNAKRVYLHNLPVFLVVSTTFGYIASPSLKIDTELDPVIYLRNIIGYSTIGFMIGLVYPISYPIAAMYSIRDFSREQEENEAIRKKRRKSLEP